MNHRKMDPQVVQQRLHNGCIHLKFECKLYKRQIDHGKYVSHEHPAQARSWSEPCIKDIAMLNNVAIVKSDLCAFGLTTPPEDEHDHRPAKKSTTFMSNSDAMLATLSRTCSRDHVHQQLVGGRCAAAALYPLPLVRAIIRGIANQRGIHFHIGEVAKAQNSVIHAITKSAAANPRPSSQSVRTSKLTRANGTTIPITYDPCQFKSE